MSVILTRFSVFSVLSASLLVFGCSSSDGDAGAAAPLYSGATTPAAITQANADEITKKSAEGVSEATNVTAARDAFAFLPSGVATSSTTDELAQKIGDIVFTAMDGASASNLPAAAVLTSNDLNGGESGPFCGGSIIYPDNVDQNAATLDFTISFNELCFTDGTTTLTLNGSLRFQKTETSVSMSFTRFSVTMDGAQESINGVFSCDATMRNCTIATDFAGSDGNVYRLADVVIDGDDAIGYTVSATFYHHEFGQVTVATTSPVTYGDCDIYPSGGIMTVSSSDGSEVTVSFSGCVYTGTGFDANSTPIFVSGSWI